MKAILTFLLAVGTLEIGEQSAMASAGVPEHECAGVQIAKGLDIIGNYASEMGLIVNLTQRNSEALNSLSHISIGSGSILYKFNFSRYQGTTTIYVDDLKKGSDCVYLSEYTSGGPLQAATESKLSELLKYESVHNEHNILSRFLNKSGAELYNSGNQTVVSEAVRVHQFSWKNTDKARQEIACFASNSEGIRTLAAFAIKRKDGKTYSGAEYKIWTDASATISFLPEQNILVTAYTPAGKLDQTYTTSDISISETTTDATQKLMMRVDGDTFDMDCRPAGNMDMGNQ